MKLYILLLLLLVLILQYEESMSFLSRLKISKSEILSPVRMRRYGQPPEVHLIAANEQPKNLSDVTNQVSKPSIKTSKISLACLVGGILTVGIVFAKDSLPSIPKLNRYLINSSFSQSFLLIFLSELGDKTFFLAALSAAKYGRLISLAGGIGALALMTIISTIIGQLFHAVPPSLSNGIPFDLYIATGAFSFFGLKTIYEAYKLPQGSSLGIEEERAEAEEELTKLSTSTMSKYSTSEIIFQIFSLVLAAEIGDRSFLSTIALSATLNPFAVALGAIAAHSLTTSIAVVAGVVLSKYFSEKVIGYIGGGLFLLFAGNTLRQLL